jgi:hypothetical protein
MFTIVLLDSFAIVYPAIMGLKPWAFLLVVFAVMVGALYVIMVILDSRKRMQNVKKTTMPDGKTRKTNAVFITEGRGAYEELCNVWMNEAEVKEQGKKVKTVGTVDAPKIASQRIPKYYLVAEYMFQIRWPKNAKKSQQTEIMEVFYRENYSLPAFSFNELSGEERTAMTAILTSISSDQNVANAVVTEIQQKFDTFTKAINKLKNLNMILYILFAVAVISLFTLVISLQDHGILAKLRLLVP